MRLDLVGVVGLGGGWFWSWEKEKWAGKWKCRSCSKLMVQKMAGITPDPFGSLGIKD